MLNRELVIKGLESCRRHGEATHWCPEDCPYRDVDESEECCYEQVKRDAIMLLKEDQRMEDDGK